jgi:hypothetical protein
VAELVARSTRYHEEARHRDAVRAEDPLRLFEPHVELRPNRGEGDLEDAEVDHVEEDRAEDEPEDEAIAALRVGLDRGWIAGNRGLRHDITKMFGGIRSRMSHIAGRSASR